ncbi:MAG TPA: hypothetical protein PKD49_02625 [Hyphomicrobium sp.]|nr:hypothetical protein [Hyphomicrobium sp.]
MTDAVQVDQGHLNELGRRIADKISELEKQGALHGPERQAAADFKLRHLQINENARNAPLREGLLTDVETLRLAFERWLARIDTGSSR